MFRILDRFVVIEWLKALGLVIGATFGLLVVYSLYDNYKELRDYGASVGEMILYYGVGLPGHLSLVVPISVLVSLLFVLGKLHRNNEITAMRAAGVSLFRITGWIWVIAVGLSALMFYLNGSVIPWSVEQSRQLYENIEFAHQARTAGGGDRIGLVNNVSYHNRAAGRLWLIARFSQYSYRGFGIQLSFLGPDGKEARRLVAAEGYWDELGHRWTLQRGREMTFDPQTREIVRPVWFDTREVPDVDDDPRWMLLLDKRPKDLSFFELREILNALETVGNPRLPAYGVRYHALLAGAFSCVIVAGFAVPFAATGVRVNPAVGVSKSLALFFLYYLLSTVGNMLGVQGTVPPWLAAWLPNSVAAGLAAVLMFRTK